MADITVVQADTSITVVANSVSAGGEATITLVTGATGATGVAGNQTALLLPAYTVAGVPGAGSVDAGAMIYVTDETGGAVPAFTDGTNWRRVTDRAVIS